MSFFSQLQQNVVISPGNSSTANLDAGATFTGTKQTTLGIVGIQVNLMADQNCTIYVDQAMDEVPNWDIVDTFNYYASKGGLGFTVQATGANVRIRVKNIGSSATTYFRLALALCPIVEALPRALSEEGNLKVGVYEIEGEIGTRVFVGPMQTLRVNERVKLVGAAPHATFDTNFWTQVTLSGSATSTVANGEIILSTGTTTASSNIVQSAQVARYLAGTSNYFRGVVELPAVTGANTRRWGAFNGVNGFYFEHNGTLLSIVTLKNSVATKVDSGSFNGVLGATYDPGVDVNTYEIHWTNSKTWFFLNGYLLHTASGTTTPLSDTVHLPIRLENTNGANINDNALHIRIASIAREGVLLSQPISARISTVTTTVLKYGPGNLHAIIFGTLPTSSGTITIYDNTAGSGTVLWAGTVVKAAQDSQRPNSVDFKGLAFSTGLTVVTATNAADFTVVYE